ncbi:MAG: lytic murein transglycosylase, partial [Pseudomonadota bacterium]
MRLILLCPLAILAACAEPAESQPPAQSAAPQPKPVPASETAVLRPANFAAWRAEFRTRALGQGISAATFDRAFQGVQVNNRVLELDRFQPEFSRPIWEYLDSAVSEARIRNGQAKARQFGTRLAEI